MSWMEKRGPGPWSLGHIGDFHREIPYVSAELDGSLGHIGDFHPEIPYVEHRGIRAPGPQPWVT
jgi:hypothetical protein